MQAAPAPYHLAEARYTDEGLPHTLQPGTLLASQDYRQLSGPWRQEFSSQWSTSDEARQYRTSDEARVGRYSWAIESDTGCENGCRYMTWNNVTDEAADHPGATIVFSAWVKAPTGHERPSIQLKYKAGDEWYYPSQAVYDTPGQWQRLEVRLDLSTITDLQHITPIARHTGTKGVPAYFDDLRVYAVGGSGDAPSGAEIRYRYSAEGQRTYTQVGTGAPTFTVRDGAAALGQIRGPADSGGDPSVDYWNVLLPSGTPIGRFVDGASNDRRYYHTDHLGSTRAVTDGSGQVVERRDHYPFGLQMPGRALAQGPQADEDYTGHELDAETGMHYAGARFYMSAIGRWGTTDPILDEQGPGALLQQDPRLLTMNAYNYTFNDPANLLDPDGRKPTMCPPCNPASQALQQGEALFNATFVEPVRQAHDAVASGISTAWENAPLEGIKQQADQTSETMFSAGLAFSAATAVPEPSSTGTAGAAGASFVIGTASDLVGTGMAFLQTLRGDQGAGEFVLRFGALMGGRGAGGVIGKRFGDGPGTKALEAVGGKAAGETGKVIFQGGIQAPDHRTRDDRLDSGTTISPELRDADQ